MNVDQYRDMVYEITKPPNIEHTVWAEHSKLCMLFVEFRYMDILKYNLWNIANVYGGGDTCLVIVHSGDNKDIIMETHHKTLIQPGESVGIVCAQSIGEKNTQMTLNSVDWT